MLFNSTGKNAIISGQSAYSKTFLKGTMYDLTHHAFDVLLSRPHRHRPPPEEVRRSRTIAKNGSGDREIRAEDP